MPGSRDIDNMPTRAQLEEMEHENPNEAHRKMVNKP